MHLSRSLLCSGTIACALSSSPALCTCPTASTSSLQPYYPPTANCVEFTIPVTFTAENTIFNIPEWVDDYALEDFLSVATTRASAGFPSIAAGVKEETVTRQIAASFCTPKNTNGDGKEKTVILATHGIGQARSHWNSPYRPEEYNFVQFAVEKGYSVFFYDRLGTGLSEK